MLKMKYGCNLQQNDKPCQVKTIGIYEKNPDLLNFPT